MSLPIEHSLAKLPQQVRAAVTNGVFTKIGVVKNVIAQDGQPSMAIVDFDDETGVETKLLSGAGTPTHPGMTVRVERKGGVIDPTWQIVDVLLGPRISFGEPIAALMAKPVIPGASFGGVYTESNTATADNPNAIADPGAPVKAKVYLYVRSIVPGSYSAYQQRAKAIRIQGRELGDTEWPEEGNDWDLRPNTILRGTLNAGINAVATSVAITVPADRINDMLVDQPAYFQVDSEIFLAIPTNSGAGVFTLSIVAHNGIDNAALGQGFIASASGRGLESTTAATHASGTTITLLSATVVPGGLKPGFDYELRVAFVNASGQAGPWSDIVGVTTWEQPISPAAVTSLTVAHLSAAIQAQWNPVTTDANGDYRSDVRRYFAVRHTAALAVGLSLASVLSAGATQVADTPATVISVPATKGTGNFIGVAAVGSEGLLSSWVWGSDTLAPPYPDPNDVEIMSVPNGILVTVPPAADSRNAQTGATIATPAQEDPGFYEFVLWKATSSTGTGAAIVARFTALSHNYQANADTTGYYKVTTADRSNNYNGPTAPNNANWTTGWKFAHSLYAGSSIPLNGTFQDVLSDGLSPRWWTLGPSVTGGTVAAQTTGGAFGNRTVKMRVDADLLSTVAGYHPVVTQTLLMPFNGMGGAEVSMWVRGSVISGTTYDILIIFNATAVYDNDLGTGTSLGAATFITTGYQSAGTPLPTDWTKVTATFGDGGFASVLQGRSFYACVSILNNDDTKNAVVDVFIDDLRFVQ